MKWGIVKLSSIGDVVHALPVAAAIRRAIPTARIEWIVENPARDLVEQSPVIDEAIVIDRAQLNHGALSARIGYGRGILRDVRSRRYDIMLDLQGLLKSGVIAFAGRAPERYGYDWLREGSSLMVKRIRARPDSVHIVQMLLDVVRALGMDPEPIEFPIGLTDKERSHVSDLLSEARMERGDYVVINPNAAWRSKQWPVDRFAVVADRIADKIGKPCLVLGGPGDAGTLEEVRRVARVEHTYLTGAVNLREYAEVCRRCAAYVGNDTGPTHLAAAMGARCVVMMGPTDPIRNGPYGAGHAVIHKGHACSPCRKKECREPVCMLEISTDDVFDGVSQVLSRV